MPKRRIAYFTGTFPALTETFVQREIDQLSKAGSRVLVFSLRRAVDPPSDKRRQKTKGVIYGRPDNLLLGVLLQILYVVLRPRATLKCLQTILEAIPQQPPSYVFREMGYLFAAAAFTYHLRKSQIDHIHAHFSTATTIALFCNYYSGITFSMAAHASGDIYVNPIHLERKLRATAVVVAESDYNREFLLGLMSSDSQSPIKVVHNSVQIQSPEVLVHKTSSVPRIVSVAALRPFKGFPTLFKALREVKESGLDFQCVIVGEGPMWDELVSLRSRLGLVDHVIMVGKKEHDEALQYMADADVFVLASEIAVDGRRDCMPTVCTEAMSYAKPVVSTYVSAIPELIEDGVTGLLVPERNPRLLARAIGRLLKDEDFRRELGANAYNHIRTHYNLETSIAMLRNILEGDPGKDKL